MSETFDFHGFAIPVELAVLTGGGAETWDGISRAHMAAYERYAPIGPGHDVLEIGCGVGRDAIPLIDLLGTEGSYAGVDVSGPSIDWCRDAIAVRHPNFSFDHLDVQSPFYNPAGVLRSQDVVLPLDDGTVDRVILQSVFTHMFEADIVHYLREIRRVLRQEGLVFASFFILDEDTLSRARRTGQGLTFEHDHGDGCRINDVGTPEGAVGYWPRALHRMVEAGGLRLDQPIHPGSWSGRPGVPDGQDIVVLASGPSPRSGRLRRIVSQASRALRRGRGA